VNLQAFVARVRAAVATLSAAQIASLAAVFVAVVGLVVWSAYWMNTPTYGVLFSDMDPESANSLVARLKTQKVAYVLDDGGRTIRVPVARIDELRLDLVGQGLPASGRIGFEIFDRTSFGVTDFLEHVNYRRALEGELARTIGTIAEVASARVHIAMARPSLFASQDQAATASVVLKLRSNKPLSASTTAAISGLLAAGVEGLRPEAVVIIDNYGRPLTRSTDGRDEASGAFAVERQQRIERDLSARVISLLEPILGPAHVRVNISAKLNTDSQEETVERFDPNSVVRSHQSVTQAGTTAGAAQGLAGVRSNMPPPAPAPGATPPPVPPPTTSPMLAQASHLSEMTNYEVGKVTTHRIQPQGQIAKLSVAVLLDDERVGGQGKGKPRSAKEIEQIHDIVAAAVGFDEERGDHLTVENIAFEEPLIEEVVKLPWFRRFSPQMLDGGRILAVLFIALLAVFGVIRPTVRRTLGPAVVETQQALGPGTTVADVEGALEAHVEEEEAAPVPRRLPSLTRRMVKATQSEPENAARLVRDWLSEDAR
jgi:flagellar M-ring protein FliF